MTMSHPPAEPTHADIPSTGTSTPTPSTSPLGYTIRQGTPEDASDISKLMIQVFSESFGHSCSPEELKKYTGDVLSPEAIRKDLENPLCSWYLAYTLPSPSPSHILGEGRGEEKGEEELLGIIQLTKQSTEPCLKLPEPRIELQRLYLSPKTHGKGLSTTLVQLAEQKSREWEYKSIWLGVWEENGRAKKFYTKMGYEMVGDHVFDIGGNLQRDEIMEKLL